MGRLKNWLESKLFWLKTGAKMEIANGGEPVEHVVIRYKEYYLEVEFDVETGKPTGGFGWSENPMMFHVPVRDILYTSNPTHQPKGGQDER